MPATGSYWGSSYFGPGYFGPSFFGTETPTPTPTAVYSNVLSVTTSDNIAYSNVLAATTPTPTPTPTATLHGIPLVSRLPSQVVSRRATITINSGTPFSLDIIGNNVYFACTDGDDVEIVVTDVNVFGVANSSRRFTGVAREGLVT